MFNEFKAFIARGNVVDLAVGIILGAAFTAIVTSLVQDVIMPPIGWLMNGIDFSNMFLDLGALTKGEASTYGSLKAAQDAGVPTINYGIFINAVIKFLIVSFSVFLLVKQVNKLQRKLARERKSDPPAPTTQEALLMEIRDLLKKK
ncbi:MAG: large conductance mechanosensitive channel protein MscL [Alphaproteobacteria bacterium]|nr:large conductance mechanosensitive channel protein MscL [Alphaproteobacteria bacterium]